MSYQTNEETYTVIWQNYDGVVLETDNSVAKGAMPSYDGDEPTKPEDDDYTYTFSGWNPDLKPVDGDITYVAKFSSVQKPSVEELISSDNGLFTEYGYTVTFYISSQSFMIQGAEDNLQVERGSLAAAIVVENNEGRSIEVYYFYKSSVAKYCFENTLDDYIARTTNRTRANYFLKGNRLYYDSTCQDFFEEVENNNNGSSEQGGSGGSSSESHGGSLSDDEVYAVLSSDYNKIRDHGGYQLNLEFGRTSRYLDTYCESMGIDRDDLYGTLSAENNIGNQVHIYYFRSNALASK